MGSRGVEVMTSRGTEEQTRGMEERQDRILEEVGLVLFCFRPPGPVSPKGVPVTFRYFHISPFYLTFRWHALVPP